MLIKKKAYAKVNLSLDVTGRRENGYHDVKMVMQNLDIYDELEFEFTGANMRDGAVTECASANSSDGRVTECASANKHDEMTAELYGMKEAYKIEIIADNPEIPTDERNLIYKAAKLLFEEFNIKGYLKVKLTKHIPVEAGMAGGSTDCAATLRAVNELCTLNLSDQELMDYGVKLGADVPYCVLGRTALSEGIGEKLTPIKGLPDCKVLVAKPPVGVSTPMVYKEYDSKDNVHHPDVDGMVEALNEGNLNKAAALMENVLEAVTVPIHGCIADIKKIMLDNGAINAIMSGSGPTVFGIFDDDIKAENAFKAVEKSELARYIFLTKPVNVEE